MAHTRFTRRHNCTRQRTYQRSPRPCLNIEKCSSDCSSSSFLGNRRESDDTQLYSTHGTDENGGFSARYRNHEFGLYYRALVCADEWPKAQQTRGPTEIRQKRRHISYPARIRTGLSEAATHLKFIPRHWKQSQLSRVKTLKPELSPTTTLQAQSKARKGMNARTRITCRHARTRKSKAKPLERRKWKSGASKPCENSMLLAFKTANYGQYARWSFPKIPNPGLLRFSRSPGIQWAAIFSAVWTKIEVQNS